MDIYGYSCEKRHFVLAKAVKKGTMDSVKEITISLACIRAEANASTLNLGW